MQLFFIGLTKMYLLFCVKSTAKLQSKLAQCDGAKLQNLKYPDLQSDLSTGHLDQFYLNSMGVHLMNASDSDQLSQKICPG